MLRICHGLGIIAIFLCLEKTSSEGNTIDGLNIKYHVAKDKQNWFQAFINCKSAGMELASLTTEEEQKDLENYMTQNGHDYGYWLSGTNLGKHKNYYWASRGKLVTFTNWLKNQPDNSRKEENEYQGENCIQWGIYEDSTDVGKWNDLTCTYKLYYICEDITYCNVVDKNSTSLV